MQQTKSIAAVMMWCTVPLKGTSTALLIVLLCDQRARENQKHGWSVMVSKVLYRVSLPFGLKYNQAGIVESSCRSIGPTGVTFCATNCCVVLPLGSEFSSFSRLYSTVLGSGGKVQIYCTLRQSK